MTSRQDMLVDQPASAAQPWRKINCSSTGKGYLQSGVLLTGHAIQQDLLTGPLDPNTLRQNFRSTDDDLIHHRSLSGYFTINDGEVLDDTSGYISVKDAASPEQQSD